MEREDSQQPATKRLRQDESQSSSSASSSSSTTSISWQSYQPMFSTSRFIPTSVVEEAVYHLIPDVPMDLCKIIVAYKQFCSFSKLLSDTVLIRICRTAIRCNLQPFGRRPYEQLWEGEGFFTQENEENLWCRLPLNQFIPLGPGRFRDEEHKATFEGWCDGRFRVRGKTMFDDGQWCAGKIGFPDSPTENGFWSGRMGLQWHWRDESVPPILLILRSVFLGVQWLVKWEVFLTTNRGCSQFLLSPISLRQKEVFGFAVHVLLTQSMRMTMVI